MNQYQWISPTGNLGPVFTLEELISQIQLGKAFPNQELVINQNNEPQIAGQLAELQDAWHETMPFLQAFSEGTGEVDIFLFGRILAQIACSKFTGYLTINEDQEGLFYSLRFKNGQLIELNAFDPSTDLGQILVQRGILAATHLQHAIALNKTQGGSIGKTLIAAKMMTERDLNQALAEQMFARIRRISKFKKFFIKLRPTHLGEELAPVARVAGYALLEIYLGYALDDETIKNYIGELVSKPLEVNWESVGASLLSREDTLYLKQLESKKSLALLAKHPRWSQRNSALKCIAWDLVGLIKAGHDDLDEILDQVKRDDVYDALGISSGTAFSQTLLEQQIRLLAVRAKLSEASQGREGHLKQQIESRLRELSKFKPDPAELFVIEKMKKMGVSLDHKDLKNDLLYDYYTQQGESNLKKQKYQDAVELLTKAAEIKDPKLSLTLNLIWAKFLASPRAKEDQLFAIKSIEKQISIHPQSPEPLLVYAQLKKAMGDLKEAEGILKKLLKIDPNHTVAQTELRILFSREFEKKKGMSTQIDTGIDEEIKPLAYTLLSWLLITFLLGYVALVVPNQNITYWPELKTFDASTQQVSEFAKKMEFNSALRRSYQNESLILSAYTLGMEKNDLLKGDAKTGFMVADFMASYPDKIITEVERSLAYLYQQPLDQVKKALTQSRLIPVDKLVMGNMEGYYLMDDLFAWARRAVLLLAGIIGFVLLKRSSKEPLIKMAMKVDEIPWLILGVLISLVVAYLSPTLQSPSNLATQLILVASNTIAEAVFFLVFIHSALKMSLKEEQHLLRIFIFALCFALYRLSFFAYWQLESAVMWSLIVQSAIFIGGTVVLVKEKTHSFLASLFVFLLIKLLPLVMA